MNTIILALHLALLLLLPLLLLGVINRTKAIVAGRKGPPLLQSYRDVWRLLHKGAVYSRTTTFVFRLAPMVNLAALIGAGLLLPLFTPEAPLGFTGDVILFAYLFGLGRFLTMAAALDTGSAFEGMGASREAAFSALSEPALFICLAILCVPAGTVSLADALAAIPTQGVLAVHPAYLLAGCALFAVLLTENSRIPVDDPNTHLELTMIHEVMVLDHSGPDFAYILYGAALKLFLFSALLVRILVPGTGLGSVASGVGFVVSVFLVAVVVGVVESTMARLRLTRIPQFLVGASVVAMVGLAILFHRGQP